MLKPPVGLTSINKSAPRQDQLIALVTERPRTKAELTILMNLKKTNLERILLTLISKGLIIPNPVTCKYEIYSKKS